MRCILKNPYIKKSSWQQRLEEPPRGCMLPTEAVRSLPHIQVSHCRLEELQRDASYAEERAGQVVSEVSSSQANVAKRQGALDSGAQQLAMSRNAIDQLAQEYAAAVSDAEMCDALVQRELREAQVQLHDAMPCH